MLHQLPPSTRIWIYQADKPFASADLSVIREEVAEFAQAWVSHNRQLRAAGDILHERFVVLAVDESMAGASGCSIDSSVAFLRSLGARHERDLFDRMRFSYETPDGQVQTVGKDEFAQLFAEGAIDLNTPVFDTLVNNLDGLQHHFRKPLGDSWHKRFVG